MLSSGLFSLLTERLMLHSSQCTMTTYNVLFEVSGLHKTNTCLYIKKKKTQLYFLKHLVGKFLLLFFSALFKL